MDGCAVEAGTSWAKPVVSWAELATSWAELAISCVGSPVTLLRGERLGRRIAETQRCVWVGVGARVRATR